MCPARSSPAAHQIQRRWHPRGAARSRSGPQDLNGAAFGDDASAAHYSTRPAGRVIGAEALEAFLGRLAARDSSENTLRAYRTAIGQYLAFLDARPTDWRDPGRATVRAYLGELTNRGLSKRSISSRLAALRSFYRYARREGLVDADPWSAAMTPRLPRRLPQVLGIAEVERLIDQAHADPTTQHALRLRDVAIVETAYAAGLRISEIAGAQLADLDLARGELRVMGKGRKERVTLLGGPAREAIELYLSDGRPALRAKTEPGDGGRRIDVPQLARRDARRARRALSAGSADARRRFAVRFVSAYVEPLVRQPPARGRRRSARGPGAARPRQPGHDPDLHARVASAPAQRLSPGTPAIIRIGRLDESVSGRTLARAGAVVAFAFLASRILGYVRVVVITNQFGAGTQLDAYFAAFRMPDAIFQLVAAGALSSAMIPVLAGLFSRGEEDRAWRVVSTVLNVMLIVLFSLSVIVAIFAPQIVPIITPGFDAVGTELTVRLTRIMLLSPILLALAAVASSVLNARGRFGAAALAPSVYNIAIIIAAVVLGPSLGVDALAVGVVFGSLLHLSVQLLPLVQEKFRLSFEIDLSDSSARQVLFLMAPRALGLGANQITFIVATMLATGVGVGAVTSYNIAWTVMQIPLGVIGFPLGIVLLPSLSRAVASGSAREFGRMIVGSVRLLLWIMLFITAVGIVVRRQVVNLLFTGLDDHAQSLTADTLSFLLLGLAGYSLVIVFARAFYSGHDTRTPVITALFDMTTSIVVGIATVGTLGLSGMALGCRVAPSRRLQRWASCSGGAGRELALKQLSGPSSSSPLVHCSRRSWPRSSSASRTRS